VLPADFTFGHAGRQFRLGPVAFWSAIGTLVVMAAWTLATASYFAFHDDLLTRLIARQAQMQYGYEDRIADLRMQVDRLASRQLLDQEQYEQRLSQLVRREGALESRAATLSTLPDFAPTGSTRSRPNLGSERSSLDPRKPSPIGDTATLSPPERQSQLEWHAGPGTFDPAAGQKSRIDVALARLEQSLARVETKQAATLDGLEEEYEAKARRIRGVLSDLGLNPGKAPAKAAGAAVGGPFVPAKLPPASNVFERQLYRVSLARSEADLLNRTLVTVPVRKPLPREVDVTSGFGVRLDPFLHRAAMHTGVDFRGDEGEPIHATASGTVTHAGWGGGYGRMVEIDHGNGIATRYGHLSGIEVEVGQHVHVGDVVGRLGSTGRSTGPHLHYETRIDNEAVDPQRFLHAGLRLTGTASQD
jgi:murein DD-endopeptidase MepM/ murein hydrolase activator NlpD